MFNNLNFFTKFPGVYFNYFIGFLGVFDKLSSVECLVTSRIKYVLSLKSKATLLSKNKRSGYFLVKLPSTKTVLFFFISRVSLNSPDRLFNVLRRKSSAGFSRLLGICSKVRGVAMNPVDHPHGGRTKSIRLQRTPWGLVAKKK
jgi:ribosomal protein L2